MNTFEKIKKHITMPLKGMIHGKSGEWLKNMTKKSNAKNAIEIGSRQGVSTSYIRDGLFENQGNTIISIDLNEGKTEEVFDKVIENFEPIKIVKFWNKTSLDLFLNVKTFIEKK